MKLVATGRTGTIGQFLSLAVEGISYREFLSHGNLPKIPDHEVNLIHLGGAVGPSLVSGNPEKARAANVDMVPKLVRDLSNSCNLRHLTYISSSHVYGPGDVGELLTEDANLDPRSEYARQKLQAETAVQSICKDLDLPFTILRVFSILGMSGKPFTLAGRLQEAARGEAVTIMCSDDKRDFLSPSGAARAIEDVAAKRPTGIFNLCTGSAMSIREAVTKVLLVNDIPLDRVKFEPGTSESPWIVGSPELLKSATGLNFSFEPGGPH